MTFQMQFIGKWRKFQVFVFDSIFLTAKEGLLPPKYAFGIDLTCDESETKYIRSVRAYYEIASLSFYELKTHIQLDKTVTIYRT